MATSKPRVQVTLDRNLYNTLKRLAKLQGTSMSAVCGDLLESCHMPLMRTVALLEAATEAPKDVREGLANVATSIEREMVGVLGSTTAQLDWALGKAEKSLKAPDAPRQGARRGSTKSSKKGANPPRSNTGGRLSKRTSPGGS